MSTFEQTDHQFYSANYGYSGINNSAGYDMSGAEQFETVNQPFGNFDYNESATSYAGPYYASNPPYAGNIMTPENVPAYNPDSSAGYEDELPLMEELGINFDHIWQKTLAALNPFKQTDAAILSDSDLAGPLVFCLLFGGSLLLSGKIHFGYIYGIGVLGCMAVYSLLNLMSMTGVSMSCTVSVLGYCLLPMVILSGVSVVFSLQDVLGSALSVIIILWCSLSASKLFVTALAMDQQQLLVAYPCALLYGVFALITIF